MSTFSTPSEDNYNVLEVLEPRIAPAGINPAGFKAAPAGSQILLNAGEGLSTSSGNSGSWLVFVEKGQAIIYTTDLNSNGQIDANEITGVSAGDGLRLISFVDIHGDIVTNLDANGNLTDSDPSSPGRDGKILLNSKIEAITLRSVTTADVPVGTNPVDRLALSSYSIYGNIYAGGGFGVVGGGLTIDTSGYEMQLAEFDGTQGSTYLPAAITPTIGSIKVGTAASGGFFNFGVSSENGSVVGLYGTLRNFKPATGQAGADIIGVSAKATASEDVDPVTGEVVTTLSNTAFNIGDLLAGDGGFGARGGNIQNVSLFGDSGNSNIIAGDGGDGQTGGAGGSIINLSDNGSNTGRMVIQTGNGGVGLTGSGGAGGALTFGNFSATGKITILLGDGGDGLMQGGSGASLTAGKITPSDTAGMTDPLAVVSTTHIKWDANDNLVKTVGKPYSLDFDGDGNSDVAYLTTDPGQLVIVYGTGTGSLSGQYTILDVPNLVGITENTATLVAGDINGDGFDDIVVAANSNNSLGQIMTFMSNGASRDFQAPIFNAMPFFSTPLISEAGNNSYVTVFNGPGAVTDLELGDFNGDGIVDLAAVSQIDLIATGGTRDGTILYMAQGVGQGLFFVNFGKTTQSLITQLPYKYINDTHSKFKIEATATDTAGTLGRDILVGAVLSNGDYKSIRSYVFSDAPPPPPPGMKVYASKLITAADVTAFFKVRKNDNGNIVPDGDPIAQTPLDFTVINSGGVFGVAGLNEDPQSLTLLLGTAAGGMSQPSYTQATQFAGIALTGNGGIIPAAAVFKGIVAADIEGNGSLDSFGIYTFEQGGAKVFWQLKANPTLTNATKIDPNTVGIASPVTPNQQVIIFDAFRAKVNPTGDEATTWGYVYAEPALDDPNFNSMRTTQGGIDALTSRFFAATVGDGGSSKLGNGGEGGSITNIGFTVPGFFDGTFVLTAGDGGNGAKNGGNGGAITGISSVFTGFREAGFYLYSGDGGTGLALGGKGGNISGLAMERAFGLDAGDGGSGKIGGDGGSIIGRGVRTTGLTDVSNTGGATFFAGNGGAGVTTGGKGGSITNFVVEVTQVTGGLGEAGGVTYVGGNGGSAVGGRGGDGGSVLSSSPLADNYIAGNIYVSGGYGGNGLTGGNGGSITSFTQSNSGGSGPKAVSILAGDGGTGIVGNGGTGGSITSVQVDGTGIGFFGDLKFNRMIAGSGGTSYGAIGGNGGSIINSSTVAQSSSVAIASGAGGDGLTKGGLGGNITGASGDSSSALGSQTLIMAGAGGDAFAFTSTSITGVSVAQAQTLAYGGTLGFGGNGGSISNYTQSGTLNGSTNLISGDGGSTRNYGTAADTKFNVGKGGSITNVKLTGDAGAIDPNTQIVSYTSTTPNTATNRDFVENFLLGTPTIALTNAVGNVGVVVGVSGSVANGAPSSPLLNGSVSGFTAQNIMSMVAGSVDRIASILSISNVTALQGVYGAEKIFAGHLAGPTYYDANGNIVSKPVIGGSLGDGAIVGQKITGIQGARVFPL